MKNVDIAGVDVGPSINENTPIQSYKNDFERDYPYYATKASEAGILWMNAEYWRSNFEESTQH